MVRLDYYSKIKKQYCHHCYNKIHVNNNEKLISSMVKTALQEYSYINTTVRCGQLTKYTQSYSKFLCYECLIVLINDDYNRNKKIEYFKLRK